MGQFHTTSLFQTSNMEESSAPPEPATGVPVNHRAPPPPNRATSSLGHQSPVPWSTGLCDCCDDINICCLTCCCPCVTFGRIAEIVDRGSTSCGVSGIIYSMIFCVSGCSCLYSCFYRSKLRGQYFLQEQPCSDCCVHCCCEMCALCQEYRELQNRGLDLSIGWHGNAERQKRKAAAVAIVAPSVQQGMKL